MQLPAAQRPRKRGGGSSRTPETGTKVETGTGMEVDTVPEN